MNVLHYPPYQQSLSFGVLGIACVQTPSPPFSDFSWGEGGICAQANSVKKTEEKEATLLAGCRVYYQVAAKRSSLAGFLKKQNKNKNGHTTHVFDQVLVLAIQENVFFCTYWLY